MSPSALVSAALPADETKTVQAGQGQVHVAEVPHMESHATPGKKTPLSSPKRSHAADVDSHTTPVKSSVTSPKSGDKRQSSHSPNTLEEAHRDGAGKSATPLHKSKGASAPHSPKPEGEHVVSHSPHTLGAAHVDVPHVAISAHVGDAHHSVTSSHHETITDDATLHALAAHGAAEHHKADSADVHAAASGTPERKATVGVGRSPAHPSASTSSKVGGSPKQTHTASSSTKGEHTPN